ncbi:hypothetical protein JL720_2680 [Aureococcus anophagefferens]|nr:hypothetical protein JL720_2680 [Aureococcus anophagefferens]
MGLFSRKKVEVSIECDNVSEGDVHDESAFNAVAATDDFMSSPKISLPYQKRIQMVIETVADEFGTPLPFTLTVQAALTLKEYDGEATVPAQPGQFAIGTIGGGHRGFCLGGCARGVARPVARAASRRFG